MGPLRKACLWVAAFALAAVTSILTALLGYGAVGAWLLGTLISTLLFSWLGGTHRVRLTVAAVLPPFVVNRVIELGADWDMKRTTRSPMDAVMSMLTEPLQTTLLALGLFVVIPISVSWVARRIATGRSKTT